MPNFSVSDLITHLTAAQNLDNARAAGDHFKLPAILRADLDADLADLLAKEQATTPAAGGRAGASAGRRAALDQLKREHDGGYRFIAGIDESTITPGQRLQVFVTYGWASGEIGDFTDARIISLARLAPTISAAEAGNAAWIYPAARLARIAAQLAIVDAAEVQATGGDSQSATLGREASRSLSETTLFRVRCLYCSATRDADQTPELVKIGYQPRRDPGEGGGGGGGGGPALPAAVQNVTVTSGDLNSGEVVVNWDPNAVEEGVTGYNVYRNGVSLALPAGPPLTLGGFTSGETVNITVSAVSAAGEGPQSEVASGTAG